ncbi:MAG: ATP-binding protein [Candidatus Sumerlaeaceae bacterium]
MTWETVKDEFSIDLIGARLLRNLAEGIYNHQAVLREYVQNGRDAYFDLWKNQGPPTLAEAEKATVHIRILSASSISIQDNGIGMDEIAVRNAKGIGLTSKSHDPELAGFRGIGIWAGFQACDELELITTKVGVSSRFKLTINFAAIRKHVDDNINIKQLLDGKFHVHREDAPKAEHYTIVKLKGLHGDHQRLAEANELCRIVSQILPCRIDPNFDHATVVTQWLREKVEDYRELPIIVDNTEVFRQFPNGLDGPHFSKLENNGVEYGWAWHCSNTRSITLRNFEFRSFRLRVHNIAVGGSSIYDEEDASHYGLSDKVRLESAPHLNWHVGEVHLTHADIVPDTPRSGLELDMQSRKAIESIRGFYEDRIAESRALSALNSYLKQIDEAQAFIDSGKSDPEEAERLQELIKKQESLTKGPRPSDKVKLRTRELLLQDATKKARTAILRALEKISKRKPAPKDKRKKSKGPKPVPPAGSGSSRTNFEELLSEVYEVLSNHIGNDPETFTVVCKEIEDVFRSRDLINA